MTYPSEDETQLAKWGWQRCGVLWAMQIITWTLVYFFGTDGAMGPIAVVMGFPFGIITFFVTLGCLCGDAAEYGGPMEREF